MRSASTVASFFRAGVRMDSGSSAAAAAARARRPAPPPPLARTFFLTGVPADLFALADPSGRVPEGIGAAATSAMALCQQGAEGWTHVWRADRVPVPLQLPHVRLLPIRAMMWEGTLTLA